MKWNWEGGEEIRRKKIMPEAHNQEKLLYTPGVS